MIAQAGQAVFYTAQALYSSFPSPKSRTWVFVCGKGHNGADGLQAGLIAASHGYKVKVFQAFSAKGYSKETALLHKQYKKAKLKISFFKEAGELKFPRGTALIIEGLLGAGVTREARGLIADCIQILNESYIPILSIDIPSGLYTDSTQLPLRVIPIATISLGSPKISSLFHPSCQAFGTIQFDKLCFPDEQLYVQPSQIELFYRDDCLDVYPTRPFDAHKYSTGKVLIIAGSKGMHGAAVLSANSALKAGAGMVKLAVPSAMHGEICQHTVEVISIPIGGASGAQGSAFFTPDHIKELKPFIDWADAVLLGPGLGKREQTLKFLMKLVPKIKKPTVIDGDGLQFFSRENFQALSRKPSSLKHVIATPHAREYQRMGGKYCYESPLEHMMNARDLAGKLRTNFILKGPTSIFASAKGKSIVLPSGNPGLATAGTGDVLAGIVAALFCKMEPEQAAGLGAYLHSAAADLARQKTGILGMTATDVQEHVPAVAKALEDEIYT
jgi:NAD(P)H-hydrate epimerase